MIPTGTLRLQIRCVTCDALLADVLNVIDIGYAMIELICAMCRRSRLEIVGCLERGEVED